MRLEMSLIKHLVLLLLVILSSNMLSYQSIIEEHPLLSRVTEPSLYGKSAYPTYFGVLDGEECTMASKPKGHTIKRSNPVINVEDYGAQSGGADDAKAFKMAWKEACSSSNSVVLLVPSQKSYILGPMTFSGPCKSNVSVMIKGTVEASSNTLDWDEKNYKHWIRFSSVSNLIVSGGGTLNGNGQLWWSNSCKVNHSLPCRDAPTALTFHSCNGLMVNNIFLKDSQQMHVSFQKCENVQASDLTISAPQKSPNTDGIHVTKTKDIEISNSVIQTGDDCISIVSGSQSIKITNITCGPGHGISIGSLGAHKSEAHVSDVMVDMVKLNSTTNGVRIKTWQGGHGYVNNIIFQNISMYNVQNPIIIDQNYCDSKKPCHEQKSAVEVWDVLYKNINGTSNSDVAIKFDCSKTVPCHGIVLQDINLIGEGGKAVKSLCKNVKLSIEGNVIPTPCV